jgi:hypothetical protein
MIFSSKNTAHTMYVYTFALSGTAVSLAGLVSSICGSQVPARHPDAYAGANRMISYIV